MEDVKGLFEIGEVAGVVSEEPGGVVLLLLDDFIEEHKRPGGGEASGRFPFFPDLLVGIPHALSHGAFEQAVLGRFFDSKVTDFALGRDSHELEPGANWESFVEG